MTRRTHLALVFVIGLTVPPAAASAETLDAIFAGRAPGESASFFVVLRSQADLSGAAAIASAPERRRFVFEALRATAEATQSDLRSRLAEANVRFHPLFLVNMIEVEADRTIAEDLSARADVALLAANRPSRVSRPEVSEHDPRTLSASTVESSLDVIRAPALWSQGFTGQGIVVGIADTGVEWTHPALKARYRGFDGVNVDHAYNWRDSIHAPIPAGNPCGADSPVPCDDHGHGTHVTGTSVGTDGGENQIGVAPGARWIGCRNMDRNNGTPGRYAECFEFFLAPTDANGANPRPEIGADVINNSWGCPPSEGCTDPDVLRAVIENTRAAGIFVSVAAGNGGSGCSTISVVPEFYEASFSVGATTLTDTIASFSSRGPVTVDGSNRMKPDVVAPGVSIRSSVPPGAYSRFSGTSMASPHVAGAVALLWSAVPALAGHVSATEALLRSTAVRLFSEQVCGGVSGSAVPNPVFGWGRIDVAAALAAVPVVAPPSPAPRIPVGRVRTGSRTVSPRN
ncbi:MAG: S8 family serine peptidase [Acidobacteriota bacterium]